MAMDFFERQDLARANSRKITLLFLLALPCVIAAVYCVSVVVYAVTWAFLAFWGSVFAEIHASSAGARFFIPLWQPTLLSAVAGATLLIVFGGALFKIKQLAPGGHVVASRLGGERLDPETRRLDELKLLHVVEEMSVASGTPMPDIYVLRGEFGLNAFVAGHSVSDLIVCVTEGSLKYLSRDELQGVIAHEYSHIFHGDLPLNMRLMGLVHGLLCITLLSYWVMSRTYRESDRDIAAAPEPRSGIAVFGDLAILVVGFLLAFIGWNGALFGRIIKGAVSRQREFLADAAAVQFTRYPEGLVNALRKVQASPDKSILRSPRAEEASHIFFCNGMEEDRFWLTSTHPAIGDRIERIETMMGRSFVPQAPAPPETAAAPADREMEPAEAKREPGPRPPKDEERPDDAAFVARLLAPNRRADEAPRAAVGGAEALADVGLPAARHLAYAAQLMDALPDSVRRATREPRGATAVIYVLLLSPIESVREAQVRLLQTRLPSELCLQLNRLLSAIRDLNELIKIPLVDLALPALRRLSPPDYSAFTRNVAELIAADREVDLFEFALQKMLRRHLEPKFRPVPKPEALSSAPAELGPACSTLLSALAHAGQDQAADTKAAFARGAQRLGPTGVPLHFVALADCTFPSVEAALDRLAETRPTMKKIFLDACARTVAADGRILVREAELLRAIADSLGCPMPPFV